MSACKRCQQRGQTWAGDPPACAFGADGTFSSSNWNCATMNALRDYCDGGWADESGHGWKRRYCDNSIGIVFSPEDINNDDGWTAENSIPGSFLVMCWYKDRGTTDSAQWLHGGMQPEVLTLAQAERLLDYIEGGAR